MDDLQKQDIKAAKAMMETLGWTVFIRDNKTRMEQLKELVLSSVKTVEELHYAKGVYDTLNTLVNYEQIVLAQEQLFDYGTEEDA